jgi:ADP-ribose pyrophosphatase YjhB (NUDIX family)
MLKRMIPGIDFIGITTPFYCIDGKGKLLLHKRSDKCRDEQGMWDTGGGQLEFGETPQECVLREVKEEYGCIGKIVGEIPALTVLRKQNGRDTHWLALPFIVKVDPKTVINNEPDKIVTLGWFTLDTLPSPLHSALEAHILKTERILYLKKFL